MFRLLVAVWVAVFAGATAATATAQGPQADFPFEVAAPRDNWEWDQDERFDDLIEQLAINEASLEAIDAAIARKTRSSRSRQSSARRFDDNNRLMDRKGGGPMNWKEFYGTNAEKFFYHPVDPNTTYHTRTYLQQAGKDQDDKSGSDVPTRQSLPVHQRPPQWDYIYRANRTAREQALADAATLQSEIAQLEERQLLLEQEQAELWCKLAFRAIRRHDMDRKPILRFTVAPVGNDPASIEQAEALSAACKFFSTALQVVLKAEEEQPVALVSAKPLLVDAWYELDDAVIGKASLVNQVSDTESALGQFMALAKILSDRARTLSEAYEGSNDQLASQDLVRKDRYRGMLQRSVVDYAQILLGLDELIGVLQNEWAVRLNTSSRATTPGLQWNTVPATTRPMATNAVPASSASLPRQANVPHQNGTVLNAMAVFQGRWIRADDPLVRTIRANGTFLEQKADGSTHSTGTWKPLADLAGIEVTTNHGRTIRFYKVDANHIKQMTQFTGKVDPSRWSGHGPILLRVD